MEIIDFKIMFLGYSKGSVRPDSVVGSGRLKAESSKQQNHGFSLSLQLSALSLLGTRNPLFFATKLC